MSIKLNQQFPHLKNNINDNCLHSKSINFRGKYNRSFINKSFNAIQTNPIFGFFIVDMISMVIPRTIIDMTRNAQAGIETLFRDSIASFTNCIIPMVTAIGAAKLINALSKPNVNTKINADNQTLDALSKAWPKNENKSDHDENIKKYVQNVLNGVNGYTGTEKKQWINIKNDKSKISIVKNIVAFIKGDKNIKFNDIENEIRTNLGTSENIKIGNVNTNLKRLLQDTIDLGKNLFANKNITDKQKYIDKLKRLNNIKTLCGLLVAGSFAFSIQFINKYITKKRTGNNGFVGVPDFDKSKNQHTNNDNKSNHKNRKFLGERIAAATGILGLSLVTIAGNLKNVPKMLTNTKFLASRFKFEGKWPNINQFRMVYALMIAGRLIAARDNNELRETTTRDYAGFLNWLVLGDIVSKLVAKHLSTDKANLLNRTEENHGKEGIIDLISNQALKTQDEIKANFKGTEQLKMIKKLNISIGAGLAYSMLTLGIIIPLLNKTITNKLYKKNHPNGDNTNLQTVIRHTS